MLRILLLAWMALSAGALCAAENSPAVDAVWTADAKRQLRADIDAGRTKPEFVLPEVRVYDSAGRLLLRALGGDASINRIRAAVDTAAQNKQFDPDTLELKLNDYAQRDGHPLALGIQRGSVVVVQHWASWCAACKILTRALDQLQDNRPEVLLVRVESDYPAMMRKEVAVR